MSRTEYIQELRARIAHLPREEQDAALTYYIEYLEEIGEENIQKAIDELGTPRMVAEQIIADYASRCAPEQNAREGAVFSKGCLVGIAVVSSPVWIPLLLALGAVVLSMIFVAAILLIVLIFCAVLFLGIGFFKLFSDVGTGVLFLGSACVCAGLTSLCIVPLALLWKATGRYFARKRLGK